uniref:hypothetical protein n=1 Tax=Enterobacter hormaechei TaxID=158836 RepID=UPI0013D23491
EERERARIQQRLQPPLRRLAELGFALAARRAQLGRIDVGDPDFLAAKLERIAVDDAIGSPAGAAGRERDGH